MQLRDFFAFLETELAKTRRDSCAEAFRVGLFLLGRVTEDFADLFFHAAAMALGAALELGLYVFLEIANEELCHLCHLIA